MKKEVEEANATKLIYNGPCVLVTCQRNGRPNVFTVSWNTPVSIVPPIVAISCVKSNYSWEIIRGTKEFTINVPEMDIVDAVFGCGKVSGREVDKFSRFGFGLESGKKVSVPSIKECPGQLECKVIAEPQFGDFSLFVAEVVSAYAEEEKFDTKWILEKAKIINHLGDEVFYSLGIKQSAKLI